MDMLTILLVIVLVAAGYVIVTYNRLVSLRTRVREAWSDIQVQMKRRYDLIPNLVDTVAAYATHERGTLEGVVRARADAMAENGPPRSQAQAENALQSTLRSLFALAEAYPQLKADRNFLELQKELVNTEDRIQATRRFFNGNVRDYRNKCETFPSNVIAGAFGFQPQDYFNVDPAVREVPSADFGR